MTDIPRIDGPRRAPANDGPAESLIVFLHGVGADGDDLIALAPYFAEALPGAAFVSPHAPFPCDMAPMGRQWFSLLDRSMPALLDGVRSVQPILDAFLDAELAAAGLTPDRLALVGFSQGTMTSLYAAPRRAAPVAGVVGYSGALIGAETLADEASSRPPILLVHGEADPVVPFAAMGAAHQALTAAGFETKAMARPGLPHSIDPEGIASGTAFLKQVLG